MIQVNEYFGGNVKSLSIQQTDGNATVGVIAAGEYEFGTSSVEYMTVVSGKMEAMLPGENSFKMFNEGETFKVEKNTRFKVKCSADTAYLCLYR